ncbi:GGDEF domain-containing response regulator [Geosporobacter ferrireducens]|uniref:GGDEF domain-containing response regulator n=1 Tax=Geosporobacter ferrireducens TaxID=1424294 RepID=UPI00139CDC46|nr:GGDEF domain-containing response regulator [Geosporobacter ferrireducens]MTI57920.1 GGDEF domain-containing response regulator [Geosporobacter ferrireducens]
MCQYNRLIKLLLVEDNHGDARLITEILKEVSDIKFAITHVRRLEDACKILREENLDIALVDLGLPDSQGYETFLKIKQQSDEIPIILLTGLSCEDMAIRAVQEGAQDYLYKEEVTKEILIRSIQYAIERQQLLKKLQIQSSIDELTGLYNRRGFLDLAARERKAAVRTNQVMLLIYIDLDGLKQVNDTFGHHEGDRAIIDTAAILKNTFRESDIIARIGGDEFVVIALCKEVKAMETITERLHLMVEKHNHLKNRPYKLSASIGVAMHCANQPRTIEELLRIADENMYRDKKNVYNIIS